ncbi:hypothetical protein NC651_000471 [Populus alba x Populus x berolinensis]|nr:hypothetical protein NC651_000471 [Populus alba x Populus x berolinensis]
MSSSCSGRQSGPPVNLEGSPFFFSFGNLFIAVGCNIRALLTEIGPQVISGCDSTCVPYYNHTTIIFGQEIDSLCSALFNFSIRTRAEPFTRLRWAVAQETDYLADIIRQPELIKVHKMHHLIALQSGLRAC